MSIRAADGRRGVLLSLILITCTAQASWWRVAEDDFATDPADRWSYAGATNELGQPLLRYEAAFQRLGAEWDQGNQFALGDPYQIVNSRLARPLGRTLTDRDTFRFGATLQIKPGTITNTLEFYQLACFGLYNLDPAASGADRNQSDNFSGNTTLVRDANDLIEFNYFINNDSFGFNPFVQGLLITRMPTNETDNTSYIVTGAGSDPFFHNTDMGVNNYLPAATNLYVEVTYLGGATGTLARRVYTAVYTNAARTALLEVNGVPQYYWTQPAPTNRTFAVDHLAFFNYASVNYTVLFGGNTPDGAGAGSFDDLYVDVDLPETTAATMHAGPAGLVSTWASAAGRTYTLLTASDPAAGNWSTAAVLTAQADFLTLTNLPAAPRAVWALRAEPMP